MNELSDKKVNAQKESLKRTGVHTRSRKPTKKEEVCEEIKQQAPKMF